MSLSVPGHALVGVKTFMVDVNGGRLQYCILRVGGDLRVGRDCCGGCLEGVSSLRRGSHVIPNVVQRLKEQVYSVKRPQCGVCRGQAA
jgi:hypothetical protein